MSTDPYLSPESSGVSTVNAKSIGCLWPALIAGGTILVLFLLLPLTRRGMPAAKRTQCKNNLKQIGLALHNYHDVYDAFPPAFTVDAQGRKLHSWRTLILPFLEASDLYSSIDLSKPWNHPANAKALERRPWTYACPSSDIADTQTTYMASTGEDCFFDSDKPRTISAITGGTSHAIAVMEVSATEAVHWMSPTDTPVTTPSLIQKETLGHSGGFQVLLADGSVRFVSTKVSKKAFDSVLSITKSTDGEW